MNLLDRYAQGWLDWIVPASWQLAVFVCLVALASWVLRGSSPRLRHALWLLVLVKVFVPPTLTAIWSLGNWPLPSALNVAAIVLAPTGNDELTEADVTPALEDADGRTLVDGIATTSSFAGSTNVSAETWLAIAWIAGCLFFVSLVVWRYWLLVRTLVPDRRVEEGPLRVILEQLALELSLRRVPDLYTTDECTSPLLFGIIQPRIVIPEAMVDAFTADELRTVLVHELMHHKHRDTWVGWLQVAAQAMFWFHPLVWWANRRIRHERECACDEAVLRLGNCSPRNYGDAIVRVLTAARGRSLVADSMVGVFERGANLQVRVEEIMKYETNKRRFGWGSCLAVLMFAVLFLPMAPRTVESQTVATSDTDAEAEPAENSERKLPPWPLVVDTSPEIGATGVDASLGEITVTFDRNMSQDGYSWTGAPPLFPPIDENRQVEWKDKRTCVLPVKLERGKFYRLGINSTDHQNFRGTKGRPATPIAIYFTTEGATRAVEDRIRAPGIVELEPANGTTDVDPSTRWLRVTFDMPMGEGMSWTGSGANFPEIDESRQSRWSRNGRTCVLPVSLRPGWSYKLGINSTHHINFQSRWGVPVEPVVYQFTTSGSSESPAALADEEGPTAGAPQIVEIEPANGAEDVDPATRELRVTFDRPMSAGMSWTGGGSNFPAIAAGKKPRWSRDKRTCILPVTLKPNHHYQLGLNSASHQNFKSESGDPLEPVAYQFRTGDER